MGYGGNKEMETFMAYTISFNMQRENACDEFGPIPTQPKCLIS